MSALTFSDILIEPAYSEQSRKNVDLTSDLGKFELKLPIISANMETVTGPKMADVMAQHGAMGILHRFNDTEDAVSDVFAQLNPVGVSIGVNETTDKKRFEALHDTGAKIFCIDVAHGHHIKVRDMISFIKSFQDPDVSIIAGNIATGDAVKDLAEWGADIVKVGIGPGSVCHTRLNTGIGVPQVHALKKVREYIDAYDLDVKVIADGGITCVGDIAKALLYSDAVMLGSFLAGTSETPGDVYKNEQGQHYKIYYGSASAENKKSNGEKSEFVEGVIKQVPFKGHVKYILKGIKEGLQSSLAYVGAPNLEEFRHRANVVELSSGGKAESKLS